MNLIDFVFDSTSFDEISMFVESTFFGRTAELVSLSFPLKVFIKLLRRLGDKYPERHKVEKGEKIA